MSLIRLNFPFLSLVTCDFSAIFRTSTLRFRNHQVVHCAFLSSSPIAFQAVFLIFIVTSSDSLYHIPSHRGYGLSTSHEMSSSRPGYHQDYIARIRYTNALPPPPFAPKLLEIATSGLSNGQYTSASFASRLAREQPLNIEADAELGMKIDLVGLPGVFDGNEKGSRL
jgi:hypothetical protein